MKRLLALIAVATLSACGAEESSAKSKNEALGVTEAAVSVCGWNSCGAGYVLTGYSCNSSCTTPPTNCSNPVTNQSECIIVDPASSYTPCGSSCATTHYRSETIKSSACMLDPTHPPAYTNATVCLPVPSSGTIQACSFCPSGWTQVSVTPNSDSCVNTGGYKDNLVTCTK
ncbi:hypothetical protein P2318_22205 [Myxococcaceae bacterium GXIMD 01537]